MKGIRNSSLARIDLDLVIGVEDLAFVQAQALDDVLVSMGMNCLLESLAQQVLTALRCSDVAIGAEHDVVGRQRIGGDEEAEIALDDAAFVLGQPVGILPEFDIAAHLDFLRHPVVRAGRQVLVPGPFVLEGYQLVDVGLAVDDALVGNVDPSQLFLGRSLRWRAIRHQRLLGRARACGPRVFKLQHLQSPLLALWVDTFRCTRLFVAVVGEPLPHR
jgi:hypothetical protein